MYIETNEFQIKIISGGRLIYGLVHLRPFALEFLAEMSKSFELILYTSSIEEYSN